MIQAYDKLNCNNIRLFSIFNTFFTLFIEGCESPSYYADGYCDDINNNQACFFDGGDCCGSNVNTQYCTECLCLEEGGEG